MKNKLLLLLFICLSSFSFAQSVNVNFTPSQDKCPGRGEVLVNIQHLMPSTSYVVSLNSSSVTGYRTKAISSDASGGISWTFTSLDAGGYNVSLTSGGSSVSTNTPVSTHGGEVRNISEPLAFQNVLIEEIGCVERRLTALIAQGSPVEYKLDLVNSVGAFIGSVAIWQPSNIFLYNADPNFIGKKLRVTVKDACDLTVSYDATIADSVDVLKPNRIRRAVSLRTCTEDVNIIRILDRNQLKDYQWPITGKLKVIFSAAAGGATHTYPFTHNKLDSPNILIPVALPDPFSWGLFYKYEIILEDACSRNKVIRPGVEKRKAPKYWLRTRDCGIPYFETTKRFSLPAKMQFLTVPTTVPAFHPANFNSNFLLGQPVNQVVDLPGAASTLTFDGSVGVPEGTYRIKYTFCSGLEKEVSFKVKTPVKKFGLAFWNNMPGCVDGTSDIKLRGYLSHISTGDKLTMTNPQITGVTPSPSAATIARLGNFPWDMTFKNNNFSKERAFFENLPPGKYTIEADMRTICEPLLTHVITTRTVTEPETSKNDLDVSIVGEKCGSFDLEIKNRVTSAWSTNIAIQRWNPVVSEWGSIDGSSTRSDTYMAEHGLNSSYATMLTNLSWHRKIDALINVLKLNIPVSPINGDYEGLFRVVLNDGSFGNTSFQTRCLRVLSQFTLTPGAVELKSHNIYHCGTTSPTKALLTLNIDGVPNPSFSSVFPDDGYSYSIVTKDNASVVSPTVQYNGIFPDLDINSTYEIEVKGGCSQARFTINIGNEILPKIVSKLICVGQDTTLTVEEPHASHFTWEKDGNPISGTGQTLTLPNYASSTHAGTYTATAHFATTVTTCNEHKVDFVIQAGAVITAGNDNIKVFTVPESLLEGNNGVVSLNNYLSGSTGNWGVWSNTGPTAFISGSIIDLKLFTHNIPYTFKYKLLGGCDGADSEAIITITINDVLLAENDNYGTVTRGVTLPTTVLDKGTIKDTFNGLPIALADVTINVVTDLPSGQGVSFDPATGIITVSTTAITGTYSFTYRLSKTIAGVQIFSNVATVEFKVPKVLDKTYTFDDVLACTGSTTPIKFTLSGSQLAVTYKLYKQVAAGNLILISPSTGIAGTGNPIDFNITPIPTSTTVYVIKATDDDLPVGPTNEVIMTDTAQVTIGAIPVLNGDVVVCKGSTVIYLGTGTAASTDSYVAVNDVAVVPANPAVVSVALVTNALGVVIKAEIKGLSVGTAIITYTNNYGCSITKSISVKEKPALVTTTPLITPMVLKECFPNSVILSNAVDYSASKIGSAITDNAITYYDNNNVVVAASSFTISAPAATGFLDTTYSAQLTNNQTGCKSDLVSIRVIIGAKPGVITLTAPQVSMCPSSSYNLFTSIDTPLTVVGGEYKYYNVPPTVFSTPIISTVTTTGDYYIQYISPAGCKSLPVLIKVYIEIPTLITLPQSAICDGEKIDLAAATTIKDKKTSGVYHYYTDYVAGVLTGELTADINGAVNVGTVGTEDYWIQHVVTDSTGTTCKSVPVKVTIITYPKPTFIPVAITAVCSGSGNISIEDGVPALPTIGGPYEYLYFTDATLGTPVTNLVIPTPTITTVPATVLTTDYYVQLRNKTTGCKSVATKITTTVNPIPSFTVSTLNPKLCASTTFDLSGLHSPASAGSAYVYYSSSTGVPGSFTVTTTTTYSMASAPPYYYIDLVSASVPHCTERKVIHLELIITPEIVVVPQIDRTFCASTNQIDLNTLVNANSPFGTFTFYEDNSGAPSTVVGTPGSATTLVAIPGSTKKYWAKFIMTGTGGAGTGCVSPHKAIEIFVNPKPTFELISSVTTITGATSTDGIITACSPSKVDIRTLVTNAANGGTGGRYKYYTNASLATTTEVTSNLDNVATGTYHIVYENITTGCKSDVKRIKITVGDKPVLSFNDPTPICWSTTAKFDLTTDILSHLVSPTTLQPFITTDTKYHNGYRFYSDLSTAIALDPSDYTNITLGTEPLVDVIKTYYVTYTSDNECESDKYPVKLIFRATPNTSEVDNDKSVCLLPGETFFVPDLILVTAQVGMKYTIFTDQSSPSTSTIYDSTVSYTAADIAAVPLSVATGGTYYIIHETVPTVGTSCKSIPKKVVLTINPIPVITVTTPQPIKRCENPSSAATLKTVNLDTEVTISSSITATSEYHYYSDVNLNNELIGADLNVSTGTYYVIEVTTTAVPTVPTTPICRSEAVKIEVEIVPLPIFTLNHSEITVCPGVTIDLTAEVPVTAEVGTFEYYDQNPVGASPTALTLAQATVAPSPATSATSKIYYVQFTSTDTGCISEVEQIEIKVSPTPAMPSVIPILPSVCSPVKVDLRDAIAPLDVPNCKFYSDEDLIIDITADPNVSYTGSYWVTGVSASGCASAKQEIKVIINPQPQFTLSNSIEVCSPDTVDITTLLLPTPASLPANLQYFYYKDYVTSSGLTPLSSTTIVETTVGAGLTATYYVVLKDINTGCLSQVKGINVTIHPNAVDPIVTDPVAVCKPSTINLVPTVQVSLNGTYEFFKPNGDLLSYNEKVAVTDSGTYKVQFTNTATGCKSDKKDITVTINELPVLTLNSIGNACEKDPLVTPIDLMDAIGGFTNPTILSAIKAGTIFYEDAALTIPVVSNQIDAPGTYTFYAQYTNLNGCVNSSTNPDTSVTFTIFPKPDAPVIDPLSVNCGDTNIDLTTIVTNYNSTDYKIYTSSDNTATGTMTPSGSTVTSGIYWVQHYTANCKSDFTKIDIGTIIKPTPTFTTTSIAAVCSPNTVNLMSGVTQNSSGVYKFFADNTATPTPLLNSMVAVSGTYYAQFTDSTTGCSSALMPIPVVINDVPSFTLTSTELKTCVLLGTAAPTNTLDLMSAVPISTNSSESYVFSEDNLFTTSLVSTVITYDTSLGNVGSVKTYYVKLVNNSPNYCATLASESLVKQIIVKFVGVPQFIVTNPIAVCQPTTINLTSAVPVSSTGTYEYFVFDGTNTTSLTTTDIAFADITIGTTKYFVELTNPNTGCKSERKEIVLTINEKPSFTVIDPALQCGGTVDLTSLIFNPAYNSAAIPNYKFYSDVNATTLLSSTTVSSSAKYYAQHTNSNNCKSDVKEINVVIDTQPTFVVTQPAIVCGDTATTTVDISQPVSTTGTYTYYTASTGTTTVPNPTSVLQGTYFVEFNIIGSTCSSVREQINVIVNPKPTLSLSSTVNPLKITTCFGGTINLRKFEVISTLLPPPPFVFEYSTDASFSSSSILTNTYITDDTVNTYYVRVKNSVTGCVSVDVRQIDIDIFDKVDFDIVKQPDVQCGGTVNLADLSVLTLDPVYTAANLGTNPVAAGYTYYTDASATNVLSSLVVSTTGTYYVQYTDTNECKSDVKAINVVINTKPTFALTKSEIKLCGDASTTANLTTTVPLLANGIYEFYDSTNDVIVSDKTAVAAGTYYAIFTNTITNCASDKSLLITVIVNSIDMITVATPANSSCDGDLIDLTSLVGPSPYTAYDLATPTIPGYTIYSDASLTAEVAQVYAEKISSSGTFYVTYTNANGCTSIPVDVTVTFYPKPLFNVIQPAAICDDGSTVNLEDTVNETTGTFTFYDSLSNANNKTNQMVTADLLVSGGGPYFVRYEKNGCFSVKTITVTVTPRPTTPTVTAQLKICDPDTIDLKTAVTFLPTGSYKYYDHTMTAISSTIMSSATLSATGDYHVTYVDPFTGCESLPADINVIINSKPDFTVTDPTAICANAATNTVNLTSTITSSPVLPATGFTYYKDQSLLDPVVDATAVTVGGKYYVKYIDSVTSCESDVKEINVIINPEPLFIVSQPTAVCESEKVDLVNTVPARSFGTYAYFTDLITTTVMASTEIEFLAGQPTRIFYAQFTNTSTNCKSAKKPITVTINPKPTFTLVNNKIELCNPNIAYLYSAVPTNTGVYSFYSDDLLQNKVTSTQVLTTGDYYVTYTDSSTTCVSDKQKIEVIINEKPVVTVTQPTAICQGNSILLTDVVVSSTVTTGDYIYYDSANTVLDPSVVPNPIKITASGTYYVAFNSNKGCISDKMQIIVKVDAKPVFTPTVPAEVCAPATIDLKDFVLPSYKGTYTYYKGTGTSRVLLATGSIATESGDYDVQFVNTNTGCKSDFETITVKINDKQTFTVTQPAEVCALLTPTSTPSTIDLKDYVLPLVAPTGYEYKYYGNPSYVNSLSSSVIAASGTFYVRLESTGTSGCMSDGNIITVKIIDNPVAITVMTPSPLCTGTGVTPITWNLLSTVTPQSASVGTYKFYTDISCAIAHEVPTADYDIALPGGTFYAQFTAVAGCKSPVSGPIVIEINETPTFTFTQPAPVCLSTNVDLADALTTTVVGGSFAYYSDVSLSSSSLLSSSNVTAAGTYYAQYTSVKGCKSIVQPITVTTVAKPVLTLNSPKPAAVCDETGVTVSLTDFVDVITTGAYEFYTDSACTALNKVDDTKLDISSADLLGNSSRKYYVKLVVGSCESTIEEIEVIINKIPTFALTNTTVDICASNKYDLVDFAPTVVAPTLLSDGIFKYYKTIDANLANQLVGTDTQVLPGTYYIQFTNLVTGCKSVVKSVTVNSVANPILSITAPAPICKSTAATSFDLSTLTDPSLPVTYKYYSDPALGTELLGTDLNVTVTGTYYVQSTSVNPTACKSNVEKVTITFIDKPDFVVTQPAVVCDSKIIDLKDAVPYQYKGEYKFYSPLAPAVALTNTRVDQAGTYSVTYTNNSGCVSDSKNIIVGFNVSPATPVVIVSNYANCDDFTGGSVKIDPYDASLTYTFSNPLMSVDSTTGNISGYSLYNSYTVWSENSTGCVSDKATFTVNVACLNLIKTAIAPSNIKVGDEIIYSFELTNTGTVELKNVTIDDIMLGGQLSGVQTTLSPGDITTVQIPYLVTQADFDAGKIVNSATAIGHTNPNNTDDIIVKDVSDDGTGILNGPEDDTVTIISKVASLQLNKIADTEKYIYGQTINYTFEVVNTGNVSLTDLRVKDKLLGLSEVSPKKIDILLPGESAIFTAEYIITKRDVNEGEVVNRATAYANDPNGKLVEHVSDNNTPDEDEDLDGIKDNDPTIIKAKIVDDIIVSNLFSPNSDNNKVLWIESKFYDRFSVSVFNRWGHTLYSKENYKNDWDGKIDRSESSTVILGNSEYMPTGTYFYMINATDTKTGNKTTKKGWLYIVTE